MVKLLQNLIVVSRNKTKFNLFNSKASLSSVNFRENVNNYKLNARKVVLLENLSNQKNGNLNFVDNEFLSDKLNIEIDKFWKWSFRKRNFFLIKFNSIEDVQKMQSNCGYNLHSFPVKSRMLETSFEFPKNDSKNSKTNDIFLNNHNNRQIDFNALKDKLSSKEFLDYLNEMNSLNELDLYLRYFIITQLEEILCQGMFSGFKIYPFGSSLAGLGDSKSDLDIVLLHTNLSHNEKFNFSMREVKSERDQTQISLTLIADILRHYVPNFSQINRILRARVPIVKMSFDLAPLDIDISIELSEESGHHGFIMANYIAYCVDVDPIVKKFFTFLKHWAKQNNLVKTIAGNWFTNFQIITLAIYYLQNKSLIKSISNYVQDNQTESKTSVGNVNFNKLLYEFFEFLISFDFEKEAISILQAQNFTKPDFSPLYIENPIERDLNICKNVNGVEFKKLLLLAYNSLDAMHNENFHLADLLDQEYLKQLEKQTKSSN